MRILIIILIIGPLCSINLNAQSGAQTQTVKGRIIDANSLFPIPGVNVIVLGSDPLLGTITDPLGYFKLENVTVGRVSLKASFVGYTDAYISNMLVSTGKETFVEVSLEEKVELMDEIVIRSEDNRMEGEVNELATVSARGFNIDETQRYAGSFNDPARMAANFAGVSSVNDGRNDIIIRGNSPTGLLWRLEGLDIPNPNHFAATGATGGPVTILNNNQLANSEFYTGAFPAMYSNATSGVFDLKLRSGNYEKMESVLQIGFNGLELGLEGPISKEKRSSYMANYRYSVPAIMQKLGFGTGTGTAIPYYQDLSFKLNFPTKNGNFKVFGLGGLSNIDLLGSETTADEAAKDLYGNYNLDIYNISNTGIIGASYLHFFNESTYWRNSILFSGSEFIADIDTVLRDENLAVTATDRWVKDDFSQWKYAYTSEFNKKLNVRNTINVGLTIEDQHMNLHRQILYDEFSNDYNGINSIGSAFLIKTYTAWQHKFNDRLLVNSGLNYLNYRLNDNSSALEPRLGFQYKIANNQKLSLAYGRHSQAQVITIYFNETTLPDGSTLTTNKNLGLTKSDHVVLAHEIFPIPRLRIRTELYYQDIFNVPVSRREGYFSMLNQGDEFTFTDEDSLYNGGTGRNIGAEITVEKFLDKGWYTLITSSFFDSKYKGSDGIQRNSIFNGNIVTNFLVGKEWTVGKANNSFAIDARIVYAGNKRFIPIDLESSVATGQEILIYDEAYDERLPHYFRADLKFTYRKQGKKVSQEWALDIQNITDRNNVLYQSYSNVAQNVSYTTQLGIWPMFTYRLLF